MAYFEIKNTLNWNAPMLLEYVGGGVIMYEIGQPTHDIWCLAI